MNQLTLRGFDEQLARHIRQIAKEHGISLNQAALRVLRKGAGLEEPSGNPRAIADALDDVVGTWSDEEAAQFNEAIADFETIDEDLWR